MKYRADNRYIFKRWNSYIASLDLRSAVVQAFTTSFVSLPPENTFTTISLSMEHIDVCEMLLTRLRHLFYKYGVNHVNWCDFGSKDEDDCFVIGSTEKTDWAAL